MKMTVTATTTGAAATMNGDDVAMTMTLIPAVTGNANSNWRQQQQH